MSFLTGFTSFYQMVATYISSLQDLSKGKRDVIHLDVFEFVRKCPFFIDNTLKYLLRFSNLSNFNDKTYRFNVKMVRFNDKKYRLKDKMVNFNDKTNRLNDKMICFIVKRYCLNNKMEGFNVKTYRFNDKMERFNIIFYCLNCLYRYNLKNIINDELNFFK